MALSFYVSFMLLVLISEVSLLSQVTDASKRRLWWGKYSFDAQPDVSAAAASLSEQSHTPPRGEDSQSPNAYRANVDYSPSSYKRSQAVSDEEPTYQKMSESSGNLWDEFDYRPFRGLDNTDYAFSDKINPMLAECSCDEKLKELEKKLTELQDDNSRLSTKVWDTVDVVQGLMKGNAKLGKEKHIVSFAAQAASNIPYLKNTEVIVFDDVLVNNGAAYDPRSGMFTVPVSGVYIFTATIVSGFNSTIESMITLDGQEVARIYSGAYKNRGSGTNTVILNLREGDEVWVALFHGNGNYVHGKWSSFSGSLIETY